MLVAMLKRVHKINRPLEPGEIVIAPVVNGQVVMWPPHRDPETGQPELHYHADPRFGKPNEYRLVGRARWEPRLVVRDFVVEAIEDFNLNCGRIHRVIGATPITIIAPAIKSRNITSKGLCPHRGFNMAQAPVFEGVKVCPLHNMRFVASTGRSLPYRGRIQTDMID